MYDYSQFNGANEKVAAASGLCLYRVGRDQRVTTDALATRRPLSGHLSTWSERIRKNEAPSYFPSLSLKAIPSLHLSILRPEEPGWRMLP